MIMMKIRAFVLNQDTYEIVPRERIKPGFLAFKWLTRAIPHSQYWVSILRKPRHHGPRSGDQLHLRYNMSLV